MPIRRTVQEVPAGEVVVEDTATAGQPWSPAQIIAVVIGAAFVILGIAALARTGLPLDHLTRPHEEVLGFRHSPLLGIIEIGFGTLLILTGVVAGGARTFMAFLGIVAAIFGVLLLVNVAPNRLHSWLGVGDPYGWLALVVGVVLLAAALFSPEFVRASRSRETRQRQIVN
jgi:hypothetical protein